MRLSISTVWERARTEPGLRRNLVAIGVLMVLGTVFAGYFLSHQRFNSPWEDRYTVYALFEEAAAVSPGNGQEVRIAGVPVGDIRDADVTEDGRARLKLRIDSEHEIHEDATIVLRPKSPLNDMYVEIDPGTPDAPALGDGDTLPLSQSVSPVQVDEVLAHLDDNAQSALASLLAESDVALAHAPQSVPVGLEASRELLTELRPVMEQLEKRRGNLARLVTALADVSAAAGDNDERLQRMATSLSATLETVATQGTPLDQTLAQLPELSTELRDTSTRVAALVGQLDPTLRNVEDASDRLPDALTRFRSSVEELDTFVDLAAPVVDRAGPVVDDLRAASPHLRGVAGDLRPLAANLQPLTAMAVPHLDDLAAFVYNTNSVASLRDANRGILRGLFAISPDSVPLALRDSMGGNGR
jgi:phospholipid/cholesterol/gamma-HCH transport system substrate-binding protein